MKDHLRQYEVARVLGVSKQRVAQLIRPKGAAPPRLPTRTRNGVRWIPASAVAARLDVDADWVMARARKS